MLGLLALDRVGPSGHVVLTDHSDSVAFKFPTFAVHTPPDQC
jgi:hypothetical protein